MQKNLVVTKEWVLNNEKEVLGAIKDGLIFIYPTDTIYGLGCNAHHHEAVSVIRKIKQREEKPLSVIVPHINWVEKHCLLDKVEIKDIYKKLPGPFTFFVSTKETLILSEAINPKEQNRTIGIRIPANWFSKLVQKANVPFVTTSVNISGKPYMRTIEDLDIAIKEKVDIIIYDGPIRGKESKKIDLRKK